MGIEIELHSGRPTTRDWDVSRATLLRGSYEHGARLAKVLDRLVASLARQEPNSASRLRMVDPFGDTVFDGQEARAALREVDGLLRHGASDAQDAAVHDLAAMLGACAATPGSYLWFIGD